MNLQPTETDTPPTPPKLSLVPPTPPKLSLVPPTPPKLSLQNPSKSQFQIKVKEIFDNLVQEKKIPPLTYVPPCTSYLNSGAFGEVCLLVSNNKQYAVKKINLKKYEEYAVHDENNAIQIIKDIIIKEIINYANISSLCKDYFCNLVGYKYDDAEFKLYIVMDYCGTDFFDYQLTMTPSNLQTRIKLLKIFKKVAEALNCLHQHGFVHFDIKPENIAIQESESDISVKLIDAGTLTHLPTAGESVKVHGTTDYMHPGLFENPISVFGKPSIRRSIPNSVNIKQTDIYSYGVTVKRVFEGLSIFPVPNFINKSYTAEEIIKTLETSIHNLEKKGGTKKSTRRRGRKRSTRR